MDTSNMTPQQKLELLEKLKAEEKQNKIANDRAYDGLKADFLQKIFEVVKDQEETVNDFFNFVKSESDAFYSIMQDYGKAKLDGKNRRSFSIIEGDFKMSVKISKVKRFDERADIAAERLVKFLENYIDGKEGGKDDPMYQLAMLAISKTRSGDFDYKQVSQLYKIEEQFNSTEFSEIVSLFKKAHTVDTTETHYYFYKKDENGVWKRVELSFNKL